jgi:hypothetical protein
LGLTLDAEALSRARGIGRFLDLDEAIEYALAAGTKARSGSRFVRFADQTLTERDEGLCRTRGLAVLGATELRMRTISSR